MWSNTVFPVRYITFNNIRLGDISYLVGISESNGPVVLARVLLSDVIF